jgi:NAD(P)-dependent dehydrogenase (short-subunit alcohol dehydrogenase family)
MGNAAQPRPPKRFVVTGANRGLGFEFTRQLLARGDRVIAGCRNPGRALRLTELAAAHPGHLHMLPLDLDKDRSIDGFAREAGMIRDAVDVLINCAGVLVSGERFGELGAKTFEESLRSNVVGPLLLSQALAPLLARGAQAKIVNISSELGSLADTTHFATPSYAISKAALNMVTRLLAAQLKSDDIVVVSVHPGWVRTDMGGANAPLGAAESIAGVLRVVDALTPAHSGRFLDHRGETMAW